MNRIAFFGNPILDLSLKTTDNYVLKKHELNEDDQCEVPINKLLEIIKDATEQYGNLKSNPGGSSLNTCRILKSLGENNLKYYGSIGDDENGKILTKFLKEQDLHENLQILSNSSTGTCICLISGQNRCLCANIGAALNFQSSFIENDYSLWLNDDNHTKIFYIEGYFLPNKFDICKMIYEKCCTSSLNLFAINLNAAYICETYPDEIKYMVEVADFVFANRWEFEALNEICGFKNLEDTIEFFFNKYSKIGKRKIIIITNSSFNVKTYIGFKSNYKLEEHPVTQIPKEKIIDTTAAGDSFVSGFLFAYLREKTISECVQNGSNVAAQVISQIGCVLPN